MQVLDVTGLGKEPPPPLGSTCEFRLPVDEEVLKKR